MATFGFAACTNHITEEVESKPMLTDGGYLKLAIHLPTEVGLRANTNDDTDGAEYEYAVYDAKILLFSGKEEKTATFLSAYALTKSQLQYVQNIANKGQISAIVKIAANTPARADDNIYALVILNDHNYLTISADNSVAVLKVPGQTNHFVFQRGKTTLVNMEEYASKGPVEGVIDINGTNKLGFLMTNAPLSYSPGGTNKPDITLKRMIMPNATQAFYPTLEEAEAHVGAEVFVERCMAKVTVAEATGKVTNNNIVLEGDNSGKILEWKVLGWNLDITNKRTYLLRNIENITQWMDLKTTDASVAEPYRFVGSMPVNQGSTKLPLYRIHWGTSPNYVEADYKEEDFYYIDNKTVLPTNNMGDAHPQYCFENTNSVSNMKYNRLTRAVITVQVGDGTEDLYCIHADNSRVYTNAVLTEHIKGHIAETTWAIETWTKAYPNGDMPHLYPTNKDVEFEWNDPKDYSKGIKSITVVCKHTDTSTGTTTTTVDRYTKTCTNAEVNPKELNTFLNLGEVWVYVKGISYFGVPIKHFGDDLTPWREGETPSVSVDHIYPAENADANYLGRFAVVRNNWYNIKVTDVTQMGSPVIPPEAPNEFGDNFKEHISVKTQVRSWRLREQGAEF